ncbi:hypothetical protein AB1Y20_013081 [Prymnesium parvum]|uniref:Fe2OG dioxygenase domain-containing protein n=1 Tax=Prymnesium parvum TaxID=97485 RepID=A0AB34IJL5_PRYPA
MRWWPWQLALAVATLLYMHQALTSLQSSIDQLQSSLSALQVEGRGTRHTPQCSATQNTLTTDAPAEQRPSAAPRVAGQRAPPLSGGPNHSSSSPEDAVQILSLHPRIFYFPNFLPAEASSYLRATSEGKLRESRVFGTDSWSSQTAGVVDKTSRSSTMYTLNATEMSRETIRRFRDRVAHETKMGWDHQEGIQVQRYTSSEGGEFYDAHYDSPDMARKRLATLVAYLEDTPEGGETIFPLVQRPHIVAAAGQAAARAPLSLDQLKELGRERFAAACADESSEYLRIKPRRGSAILFYSFHPDGSFDPLSLHGSCPVRRGEKWIAQQWVRDVVQRPHESPSFAGGWGLWGRGPPSADEQGRAVFLNRRAGGPPMLVEERVVGAAAGVEPARLFACSEPSDMLRGLASAGAWTVLVRIYDLNSCEEHSSSQRASITLASVDSSGGVGSVSRGGCCSLRLELRGCTLELVGPTEKVSLRVVLTRHTSPTDETFVAWSGALTVDGLYKWPAVWEGISRVWVNGVESQPAAATPAWSLPDAGQTLWNAAAVCAEQPLLFSGAWTQWSQHSIPS